MSQSRLSVRPVPHWYAGLLVGVEGGEGSNPIPLSGGRMCEYQNNIEAQSSGPEGKSPHIISLVMVGWG